MFSLKETEHGKFAYRCQACGWQRELTASDRMMAVNEALTCSERHKCDEPESAANLLENTKEEQARIQEAVRSFATAIGCALSVEGGKEFARVMMVALAEAAFEGGDIYAGVARRLLTFRPAQW
jgi:hypothetical protein